MHIKEKEYAASCIKYHNNYIRTDEKFVKRQQIYQSVIDFYSKIQIELSSAQESNLKDSILNPETIFLEVAHDGQFPHLGIVQMVLKTYHVSTFINNSMVLYFIGDHYSADMRAESTLFGIPQMGVSPDKQKKPIVFKIGRKNQHVPLKWIAAPSAQMIDEVERGIRDWIVNNISYEKKKGNVITDVKMIENNLKNIISILRESAKIVDNYGDWIIRVQYILFKELLGDDINKIVFLPFTEMTKLAKKEYIYNFEHTREINSIKKEVSKKQVESGLIPYQKTDISEDITCFWLYCPNCKRRTRPIKCSENGIAFKCRICNSEIKGSIDDLWDMIMPDIIAFENAYFRLGIGGWIIGSKAPYHDVISETYTYLYGVPMPPKFLLSSIPVYRGIGDSDEGYGRTTLMRALLETSNEKLFESLMSPWGDNPYIESDFLAVRSKIQ